MATIAGLIQQGRCMQVPIPGSDGNFYLPGVDSGATTKLAVAMSATPGGTYLNQDGLNEPATGDGQIQALCWAVDGDSVLVFGQQVPGVDFRVIFGVFSMASKTWQDVAGAGVKTRIVKSGFSTNGPTSASCAVRSDGSVVLGYNGPLEAATGNKARVDWQTGVQTASDTWTFTDHGHVNGGAGLVVNQFCARVQIGASDVTHVAFNQNDGTTNHIMSVALSQANVLATVRDTGFVGNATDPIGMPTSVVHANVVAVQFPYNDNGGTLKALTFASSSDPSAFSNPDIASNLATNSGGTFPAVCLAFDGKIARAVYCNAGDSNKLYIANDQGVNTWVGTNTKIVDSGFTFCGGTVIDTASGPSFVVVTNVAATFGESDVQLLGTYNALSKVGFCDLASGGQGPFFIGSKWWGVFVDPASQTRIIAVTSAKNTPADGDWSQFGVEVLQWINTRHRQSIGSGINLNNGIRSITAEVVGSTIVVYSQNECGLLTKLVLDTTQPSATAWTTRLEKITDALAGGGSGSGSSFTFPNWGPVSNGNISAISHDGVTDVLATYHSSNNPTYTDSRGSTAPGGPYLTRLWRKTGGVWVNEGKADPGVANTNYFNPMLTGVDTVGRLNWQVVDNTNADIYVMSYSLAGVFAAAVDAQNNDPTQPPGRCGRGLSVGNVMYGPYISRDNAGSGTGNLGFVNINKWTSGATPTVATLANVSGNICNRNQQGLPPPPAAEMIGLNLSGTAVLVYVRAGDLAIQYDWIDLAPGVDKNVQSADGANKISAGIVQTNFLAVFYQGTLAQVPTFVKTPLTSSNSAGIDRVGPPSGPVTIFPGALAA